MAAIAAEALLWCVVNGSLSLNDVEIERRPYHRNCGCALHKLKGEPPTACSRHKNMSFPKRELSGNFSGKKEKRMAAIAAEALLWCVVNGSLSLNDVEIERRPYHRNCGCALHKLKGAPDCLLSS
ncbi:hypothetical protein NL676_036258 [Syzygium grande]|nr:hypothetical protein NL676_036258 [Syzygium grande]